MLATSRLHLTPTILYIYAKSSQCPGCVLCKSPGKGVEIMNILISFRSLWHNGLTTCISKQHTLSTY